MKPINSLRLAVAMGLSLGMLPHAFAAGTSAGSDITNTASVDYKVGGVSQTPVDSNTTTFKVDRKINLTVAEVGGATTTTVPGATAQVTTFTVTNNANSTLDFKLAASNKAGDDFDLTGLAVYVESGATPGYQAAEDTATYIDELAADGSKTVYVVGAIPAGATNGQVANVTLTATAAQSVDGSGNYVATAGSLASDAAESNVGVVDDPAFVDTVFGDIAGSTDAARDGKHSADDSYTISTATIAVTKSSTVITDPFNCTTAGDPASCTSSPKAIPGAVVEYCLDVSNSGGAAADSIVLTDSIPTNTTYVPSSIMSGATGTGTACDVGSGTAKTDASDVDSAESDGSSVTIRSASIGTGASFKATFRVKVD